MKKTQFDETTNRIHLEKLNHTLEMKADAWRDGRNSTKASLEVLARAFQKLRGRVGEYEHGRIEAIIESAISEVHIHGNWPLEGKHGNP